MSPAFHHDPRRPGGASSGQGSEQALAGGEVRHATLYKNIMAVLADSARIAENESADGDSFPASGEEALPQRSVLGEGLGHNLMDREVGSILDLKENNVVAASSGVGDICGVCDRGCHVDDGDVRERRLAAVWLASPVEHRVRKPPGSPGVREARCLAQSRTCIAGIRVEVPGAKGALQGKLEDEMQCMIVPSFDKPNDSRLGAAIEGMAFISGPW